MWPTCEIKLEPLFLKKHLVKVNRRGKKSWHYATWSVMLRIHSPAGFITLSQCATTKLFSIRSYFQIKSLHEKSKQVIESPNTHTIQTYHSS